MYSKVPPDAEVVLRGRLLNDILQDIATLKKSSAANSDVFNVAGSVQIRPKGGGSPSPFFLAILTSATDISTGHPSGSGSGSESNGPNEWEYYFVEAQAVAFPAYIGGSGAASESGSGQTQSGLTYQALANGRSGVAYNPAEPYGNGLDPTNNPLPPGFSFQPLKTFPDAENATSAVFITTTVDAAGNTGYLILPFPTQPFGLCPGADTDSGSGS